LRALASAAAREAKCDVLNKTDCTANGCGIVFSCYYKPHYFFQYLYKMPTAAAQPVYDYYAQHLQNRFQSNTAIERKAFYDYLSTMELLTSPKYNALTEKEQGNVRKAYRRLVQGHVQGSRIDTLRRVTPDSNIIKIPTRKDFERVSNFAFQGVKDARGGDLPQLPMEAAQTETTEDAREDEPPFTTGKTSGGSGAGALQMGDPEQEEKEDERDAANEDTDEEEEEEEEESEQANLLDERIEVAGDIEAIFDLMEETRVKLKTAEEGSEEQEELNEDRHTLENELHVLQAQLEEIDTRIAETGLVTAQPKPLFSGEGAGAGYETDEGEDYDKAPGVTTKGVTEETKEFDGQPPAEQQVPDVRTPVQPTPNTAEHIEDQMKSNEYEYVQPQEAVEAIPVAPSGSVEQAVEHAVLQVEEQVMEQEISDAIAREIQEDGDALLTAAHQNSERQILDPNIPVVNATVVQSAQTGLTLAASVRERIFQEMQNYNNDPNNDPRNNPFEELLNGYDQLQATQDAIAAPTVSVATETEPQPTTQETQTGGNVGAQGEGDPALLGDPNTDYYYDLPAFLGEGGGQPAQSGAQQISGAIMDKLKGAQGAASAIGSADIGKMVEGKSIDHIKKDIQALCYLFDSVVPALKNAQVQQQKQMVMRSTSRSAVVDFYAQIMKMVKQYFASDELRVGVVVSPQSLGGGGGGGGGGGLPGMGAAGYSMNKHGQDTFHPQRGAQFVNRGGLNYRRPIENRVPPVKPSLRPQPAKLGRTLTFPNVPFPTLRRAATSGVSFTLRASSQIPTHTDE
jgi:hypothetical protein